ncbi:MAG TPA: tetratricopeptide repeat protein [Burkholderiales bacterium]
MSLLLEALKKAELAKQAAKEPPPSTDRPPFTRDQLPDIRQPMEIHSDDLRLAKPEPAARPGEKPVLEFAPEEPPPRAAPAPQPAPATRAAHIDIDYSPPSETVERKQAQQLFEAKELDVNPRKPFYLTVGALGLFALGTVGYFWYQLQPRSTFRAPPPSAQPAPPPAAAAPAAPAAPPDAPAASTVTPPVGSQSAVPATGDSAPRTALDAVPAAPRGPAFARQNARAAANAGAAAAPQPGPARRESNIRITPARVQSDPLLEGAFQAFNAGDLATARADYQQVLRYNPDSRDALLGQAAVETQAKRYDAAEGYYTRLLELDPRDAYAQAGLIGLRGQVDPLAAESRLKNMIAAQPEASFLHFTLGNQYAAQGRWAEAQQAYFQAYTSDPDHPDFAYNLAISLDRMHQTKPALEYYRRALALAESRPVSFDKAQVSNRVSQLERGP